MLLHIISKTVFPTPQLTLADLLFQTCFLTSSFQHGTLKNLLHFSATELTSDNRSDTRLRGVLCSALEGRSCALGGAWGGKSLENGCVNVHKGRILSARNSWRKTLIISCAKFQGLCQSLVWLWRNNLNQYLHYASIESLGLRYINK